MPRLVIKDTALVKVLTKHYGFYIYGRHGSHVKFRDDKGHTVIVSIHNEDVKQGTLNAILRQSGLEKSDILKYV
jgi:predicted RNA binding protein YcfA (HicA-like mRNA interferase family)